MGLRLILGDSFIRPTYAIAPDRRSLIEWEDYEAIVADAYMKERERREGVGQTAPEAARTVPEASETVPETQITPEVKEAQVTQTATQT